MARQVFFDPFGSETQGFNLGANTQMQAESGMRQARAQDYDYNNFAPLRLAAAQRQDQLGQAALPFQKAQLPLQQRMYQTQVFGAEKPYYEDFFRSTHIGTPLQQAYENFLGLTPRGINAQGQPRETITDAQGQPHWVGDIDPTQWLRQLMFPQTYQSALGQSQINLNNSESIFGRYGFPGLIRSEADSDLYGARAEALRNQGGMGGGLMGTFFDAPAQAYPGATNQMPPMNLSPYAPYNLPPNYVQPTYMPPGATMYGAGY